jgi:ABC-2 type transport system ATP-binding protein
LPSSGACGAAPGAAPVLEARALRKVFRTSVREEGLLGFLKSLVARRHREMVALEGIDLVVGRGEFVGLIGANGAGKTTLVKLLAGIVPATSGEARLLSRDSFHLRDEEKARLSLVMGQRSQLWWDIPAFDSFQLLQRYYEIPDTDFKRRIGHLGEMLGVTNLFHTHLRRLSLGERMKMELMACLLHNPDLCFLDEPTIGLDIIAQKQIRDFFKEYQRNHRTTIILTSHYMADIEALCPRIVLVLKGQKRFDGAIEDFEGVLGREKFVSLAFSSPPDREHGLWNDLNPQWDNSGLSVELQIKEERLREISIQILSTFPVIDYSTEKLPIERVLKTLLANPHLLPG